MKQEYNTHNIKTNALLVEKIFNMNNILKKKIIFESMKFIATFVYSNDWFNKIWSGALNAFWNYSSNNYEVQEWSLGFISRLSANTKVTSFIGTNHPIILAFSSPDPAVDGYANQMETELTSI